MTLTLIGLCDYMTLTFDQRSLQGTTDLDVSEPPRPYEDIAPKNLRAQYLQEFMRHGLVVTNLDAKLRDAGIEFRYELEGTLRPDIHRARIEIEGRRRIGNTRALVWWLGLVYIHTYALCVYTTGEDKRTSVYSASLLRTSTPS